MKKNYKKILNHICYFILSFMLLVLWLFTENGDKYVLFWATVNLISIFILLTFGQRYYKTVKEVAEKYNKKDEKWYCLLCVYIPLYNTLYAGFILVDSIRNKMKSLNILKK